MTKVNNDKSGVMENDFGVPQDSILSALLLIICINDMPNILQKYEIMLYAYDMPILTEAENETQRQENLMHNLDSVYKSLKMNKLKLNENKTKIMGLNMNSNLVIKFNNKK